MAIHGEPAFAEQHDPKAGEIHSRATYGPRSGPLDNLRLTARGRSKVITSASGSMFRTIYNVLRTHIIDRMDRHALGLTAARWSFPAVAEADQAERAG